MLRPCACAVALALLAGCTPYHPFDSVGHLRDEYAQRVGAPAAAALVVPFQIDDAVRAALPKRRQSTPLRRLNQVMELIFENLHLQYELQPTRTAVETFRDRRGNCLSFVNLFVGLARANDLDPYYVEVTDYQRWSHRDGMVVSQGHIVAGMYLDGELKTYDFLPYRPKAYRAFHPIDDLHAAAHYYNNLGAEALLAGDVQRAQAAVEAAAKIAPDFPKALNNVGVVRARRGDSAGAETAYKQALALDPDNDIVKTNYARLLQQAGRKAEADAMLVEVAAANTSNPYFFVYQADMALGRGDTAQALDYAARALRLDSEDIDVHMELVKVYLALGETEKARHHLDRALKLDASNQEARRYARMLGSG